MTILVKIDAIGLCVYYLLFIISVPGSNPTHKGFKYERCTVLLHANLNKKYTRHSFDPQAQM